MNVTKIVALFVLIVSFSPLAESRGAGSITGSETYAVIIGVLDWEGGLTSYSPDKRKDVQLAETLVSRGVKRDNIVMLLDDQATLAAIRRTLRETVKRAGPGSTFIFYYAGHGMRNGGRHYFANYDLRTGDVERSGFALSEIDQIVSADFLGDNVLLLGDCCHSGGLGSVAQRLEKNGYAAAALTSTTASLLSTHRWTFTMCMVDAFSGRPLLDRNQDGYVTLEEAAVDAERCMRFYDRQIYGFATHGLPPAIRLSDVSSNTLNVPDEWKHQLGEFVYVQHGGVWSAARIVGATPEVYTVQLQQYNERPTFEVPAAKIRTVSEPQRLSDIEALEGDAGEEAASLDGKYSRLLRRIKVADDVVSYGSRYDWGKWSGSLYREYHDLPTGYWVYVYPNWYIWETMDESKVDHAFPQQADLQAATSPFLSLQILNAHPGTDKPAYSAEQATGEPDTPVGGDYPTAWASATRDGQEEWLELTYEQELTPVQIAIYETYNPGAVTRIVAVDDQNEHVLWEGKDPLSPDQSIGIAQIEFEGKRSIRTIRIYLDSVNVSGWNEIDAVSLTDSEGEVYWAVDARASSAYGVESFPDTVPEEEFQPPAQLPFVFEPLAPESETTDVASFDPRQATGAPDTPNAGDYGTCWAPATADGGLEWLDLTYDKPVSIAEVHVYENCGPGSLVRVTVFEGDEEIEVWRGKDPVSAELPKGIARIAFERKGRSNRVRVYFDTSSVPGWNEIDAVGLQDHSGEIHWAVNAESSTAYGRPVPVQVDRSSLKFQVEQMEARLRQLETEMERYRALLDVLKAQLGDE